MNDDNNERTTEQPFEYISRIIMPTLQQLQVSNSIREELAGIKRSHPNSSSEQEPPPNASAFVPIKTPSALLSRDPQQLAIALNCPLQNLKDIRSSVADALIVDPFVGHSDRPCEVADGVQRFCLHPDFHGASRSSDHDDGGGNHRAHPLPPQFIIGSISSLEMSAHSLFMKRACANARLEHLSTGSDALDSLLAPTSPSIETISLGYPFDLSRANDKSHNDNSSSKPGGIPFGMITEFSGPPSSGKTQLSLSIIARAVVCTNIRVIYIRSGDSSSVCRRLYAMCVEVVRTSSRHANNVNDVQRMEMDAKTAQRMMERIAVTSCFDAYSLLALLAKIESKELSHGDDERSDNGTLLVVDSISGCIGHHLSDLAVGAALANQVGLTLRRMTRSLDCRFPSRLSGNETACTPPHRFAVVVTNGSVASWSDNTSNKSKPAMGRYWHANDIGLWIEDESQSDGMPHIQDFYDAGNRLFHASRKVARASLLNHYDKPCGGRERPFVKFAIRTGGVFDIPL